MQAAPDFYRYYAPDYEGARRKFVTGATAAGAELSRYTHPSATGPAGEMLSVDVAVVGALDAPKKCLVISGTHGQEGFAGSAAQLAWLESDQARQLPRDLSVVLVHGLNPYGFAHWSRTTENNVDLNRNFVDHAQPYPTNPHYAELHPFIVDPAWNSASIARLDKKFVDFFEAHGADVIYNTLQSGQYTHPDGVIYGGDRREWSNLTLEAIMRDHFDSAEKVGFIDWHTGIGDYARSFFLCFNEPGGDLFERAVSWWGAENVKDQRPHGLSRPKYTGLVFQGVQQFLGDRPCCGAVVEFGTRGIKMRRAIRLDLWLRTHGRKDTDQYELLRADMADAFLPVNHEWREATISLGREITSLAVNGMADW